MVKKNRPSLQAVDTSQLLSRRQLQPHTHVPLPGKQCRSIHFNEQRDSQFAPCHVL
jgi:hypothetical protein